MLSYSPKLKYSFLIFALFFISSLTSSLQAQEIREYNSVEINHLTQIKYGLITLDSLSARGVISNSILEKEKTYLRQKARQILKENNLSDENLDKLLTKIDEKSGNNVFAQITGFFSFMNIIWVIAGILLVIAVAWLINLYLWNLLVKIPVKVYEILIYLLCFSFIISANWFRPGIREFIAFPGCLGLMGALAFSYQIRGIFGKSPEFQEGATFFSWNALILSLIWGIIAFFYQSSLLGFMSILALHSSLGFSVLLVPGCLYLGFSSKDVITRSMLASLVMIIVYIVLKFNYLTDLSYIQPFAFGALFMGSFVYYLGLLIISNRYYNQQKKYILLQVITIVSGILALFIGSVEQIPTLQNIGGTFFFIYLLEKYYEISWGKIGWAWSLLGLAVFLYATSFVVKMYPEFFFF